MRVGGAKDYAKRPCNSARAPPQLPLSQLVHSFDLLVDDVPGAHTEQLTERAWLNLPASQVEHVSALDGTRV